MIKNVFLRKYQKVRGYYTIMSAGASARRRRSPGPGRRGDERRKIKTRSQGLCQNNCSVLIRTLFKGHTRESQRTSSWTYWRKACQCTFSLIRKMEKTLWTTRGAAHTTVVCAGRFVIKNKRISWVAFRSKSNRVVCASIFVWRLGFGLVWQVCNISAHKYQ